MQLAHPIDRSGVKSVRQSYESMRSGSARTTRGKYAHAGKSVSGGMFLGYLNITLSELDTKTSHRNVEGVPFL